MSDPAVDIDQRRTGVELPPGCAGRSDAVEPSPENRAEPRVVVDKLSVRASTGLDLFGPMSFRMAAGEITALTGPSGSGKTTLMRALLGQLPSGAARCGGSVRVAGHDVFALDPAARQHFRRTNVAYVGQDPGSALNPLMRVHNLVREVAGHASRAEVLETLELVGLSAEHLRRRTAELSGGQQRRVALARALIRRTGVLILDEPLAGLHGALRTDIAHLLTEIAAERATAILLSGHDTTTVHAIATDVIELGSAVAVPSLVPDSRAPTEGTADNGCRSPELAAPVRVTATRDRLPREVPTPLSADSRRGFADEVLRTDSSATASSPLLLRANNINARIGDREILADVDLELAAGTALAVVGVSGAGKTTLARAVAGLHRTATGSLELNGTSLPLTGRKRTANGGNGIQLVTQNPRSALNPRRTVAQTLGRPLRRLAAVPRRRVAQEIEALLASVELSPALAVRYPHELSGGQRQRVALARALAARPTVLICDEITSALDHTTAESIMTLLDRLRAERAMGLLVISHDMALVAAYCPRLLVLDHGRVVESGATRAILAAPAHPATRELLG
ncbi:peptide/nickel transport system ATP-binding protein [Nocardia tenerifensis]|uniref:Peptide/nickel transport system ATP-binding protein n=1 Tax=Nocardia tenerifensis TaxID=228006 RepID=A0A318KAV1_9NOCA|nr:ATP-binding cassette domain-containing protein [Nocardia tenerifensis]PXX68616.1 peptide/nickel transport system ATP-binding protein [Nocardia tenerifensis]